MLCELRCGTLVEVVRLQDYTTEQWAKIVAHDLKRDVKAESKAIDFLQQKMAFEGSANRCDRYYYSLKLTIVLTRLFSDVSNATANVHNMEVSVVSMYILRFVSISLWLLKC